MLKKLYRFALKNRLYKFSIFLYRIILTEWTYKTECRYVSASDLRIAIGVIKRAKAKGIKPLVKNFKKYYSIREVSKLVLIFLLIYIFLQIFMNNH